jgi:hypothetical protein
MVAVDDHLAIRFPAALAADHDSCCATTPLDLGHCRHHGPLHGQLHYHQRNPKLYLFRDRHVTKIMPIELPIPRGTVFGGRVGGPPLSEAEHYSNVRCAGIFSTA